MEKTKFNKNMLHEKGYQRCRTLVRNRNYNDKLDHVAHSDHECDVIVGIGMIAWHLKVDMEDSEGRTDGPREHKFLTATPPTIVEYTMSAFFYMSETSERKRGKKNRSLIR